jgi:hypothetical protein
MRLMKSARFIVVVLLVAGIWFAWPAVIDLIFDELSLEGCLVNWQGAPRRAANFAVVMICITPAIVVWAFIRK